MSKYTEDYNAWLYKGGAYPTKVFNEPPIIHGENCYCCLPKEDKAEKARDKQVGGSHYQYMAIQPGEYIVQNGLGWYEGNVIKYVTRHKSKGGKQDLEKAIHYLQLAIEEYYDKEG